ncbi:MAG: hypothetical protein EP332_00035 [Bacteroidetes bacterium]|nr:MAG: hypothetical protein EP332_00035 [Bacteroidota bacterium]
MTKLYCSHKLKDFLGPKFFDPVDEGKNRYGDWNAHLFYYGGRKNLILVNNVSYYAVFITDVRKADFKDFSTLFFNRLTEQLQYDRVIDASEVLITIQKYTPISFARTNNDKKTIGTINDFIYQYEVRKQHPYWEDRTLLDYNSSINNSMTGAGRTKSSDYGNPKNDMRKLLVSK